MRALRGLYHIGKALVIPAAFAACATTGTPSRAPYYFDTGYRRVGQLEGSDEGAWKSGFGTARYAAICTTESDVPAFVELVSFTPKGKTEETICRVTHSGSNATQVGGNCGGWADGSGLEFSNPSRSQAIDDCLKK